MSGYKERTGSDAGTPRQNSRSRVTDRVHFTNTRWSKSQLNYSVLVITGMLGLEPASLLAGRHHNVATSRISFRTVFVNSKSNKRLQKYEYFKYFTNLAA
jgi:hypothetical protein